MAESASGKENDVTKDNAAEGVTEPSGETPTEEDTEQPAETSTENESESQATTENVTEAGRYMINLYYENNGYEKVTKDRGTLLSNIDAPLIEGKRFEGWYYDSAFKNAVGKTDILTKNTDMYAKVFSTYVYSYKI